MCVDLEPSAEQGLHLGAMSGMFDVLQRHYPGMRPSVHEGRHIALTAGERLPLE